MRILRRFSLETYTDLYVFIFGGRQLQTDDPDNAKLVLYRPMECEVRHGYLTRIVQVLCLGGHRHAEAPNPYAL